MPFFPVWVCSSIPFLLLAAAVILAPPPVQVKAWPSHGSTQAQLPWYAQQWGIPTTPLWYEDFSSPNDFDTTNSYASGFKFYAFGHSITTWQGSPLSSPAPVYGTDYFIANNQLTIKNLGIDNEAGGEFGTGAYIPGNQSMLNTLPLVYGGKPFYCELEMSFSSGGGGGIEWIQDQTALLRSITNSNSPSTLLAELDQAENKDQSNAHGWTGSTTNPTAYSNTYSAASPGTFNQYGVLGVPRSYNGGTGFYSFYRNQSLISPTATWTTGTLGTSPDVGLENSNMQVMLNLTGKGPNIDRVYNYIACWGNHS